MRWIIAYDVTRDLDRERVAARLSQHGLRLQQSVFQVEHDDAEALVGGLAGLIDLDRDTVQAFRQCEACEQRQHGIGQTGPSLRERWWVA